MTEVTTTSFAGLVGTWQLDPKKTTIRFHTTAHWGLNQVVGTLRALRGSGLIGEGGQISGELGERAHAPSIPHVVGRSRTPWPMRNRNPPSRATMGGPRRRT
jgi:hypothetical protein